MKPTKKKSKPAKFILYRRLFNPQEGEKDLRILVAKFGRHAENEAKFCHAMLQGQSTAFGDASNEFSKYRYVLYTVPDKIDRSKFAGLQIDDSRARRTGRPIAYELTWNIKHGRCHILAYHKLFGSVRAEVDDTIEARQFFVRGLKRVWPNGSLSTK